jgi:superfamily I DNA/RNA helicase
MDSTASGASSDGLLEGLNDAQRSAVTSAASPLCVLAGAGSGKTRVLTRRIAWRVARGDAHPGHALALTFTRKAAGELNSRLSSLGMRDRVASGTFHGTAYTQLRRYWPTVTWPPLLSWTARSACWPGWCPAPPRTPRRWRRSTWPGRSSGPRPD